MNGPERTNLLIAIFDLHFGGISNLILQTTPALMKKMNVEVVYFGQKDEMLNRYRQAGINTRRISYRGFRDVFKAGKELAHLIKESQIDVVSTHLVIDKMITTVARKYAKFKLVSTFHSVNNPYPTRNIKYFLNSKFEDYFHNNVVDKNFAVSEASLNSWKKYRNLRNKKSRVLYSGIKKLPCKISIAEEFTQKDKIFVTACRFTPEKGLIRLIRLFHSLDSFSQNWQFWLIGTGGLEAELEKLVSALDLSEKILFKGFQTDLCPLYSKADFYINGSFHEALPVSILESMSIGLPVVGSDVGGIPEVISHKENGYLVDFRDEEEPLNVLKECLEMSRKEYSEFSREAVRTFNSKFSIERYVNEFSREMEKLTGKKMEQEQEEA